MPYGMQQLYECLSMGYSDEDPVGTGPGRSVAKTGNLCNKRTKGSASDPAVRLTFIPLTARILIRTSQS